VKLVIQRVKKASVEVEGKEIGSIGQGLMVLVGLTHTDTQEVAVQLAKKLFALRIFADGFKPINSNIADVDGEFLLVSQFTLYANMNKGNRPSFADAMAPEQAEALFDFFVQEVKNLHPKVQTGQFGADMQVSLINDGPTTIVMERA
jgi:D-tyrosyl-tRNA(Tyr) deacylase